MRVHAGKDILHQMECALRYAFQSAESKLKSILKNESSGNN